MFCLGFFFFKQKTAYEMRISDWSSDVCSSDLRRTKPNRAERAGRPGRAQMDVFLDELAASSNVAASARAAGVSANAMYRERRRNAAFAKRWLAALCEGYARLEAELLSEALVTPHGNVKEATLKSQIGRAHV